MIKNPVWMNKTIKSKIKAKNVPCKKYIQNGRFESDFICLENVIIEFKELISSIKACITKPWNSPLPQAKSCWLIVKTFYSKKTPLIPLLLLDN